MANNIVNAISIDVEDFFQVSAFEKYIKADAWDDMPNRIERNVDNILDILSNNNTKATFFFLGWVADKYPHMVKTIANLGHEIASHGFNHVRIVNQSQSEFRDDITKTKHLLEDLSGLQVRGYRAASYSITKKNLWAHGIIEDCGYCYSSSVYPIKHDLYGIPDAPRFPYKPGTGNLLEVPISTIDIMGHRVPCGGGGFFRLYPYSLSRYFLRRINLHEKKPHIFYFHPWELDCEQPVVENISYKAKFRHYHNIHKMEQRLNKLLKDFTWDRMDRVFLKDEGNKE